MKKTVLVHGALFLVGIIYGLNYNIAKMVMPDYIEPFGLILIRISATVVLLWIIQLFWVKEFMHLSDLKWFILCAVFGVAINQLAFFKGLSITSPVSASIIMTINPIMVLIFSHFLIKERITWVKAVGIALGAAGTIMMVTKNGIHFNKDGFLGDSLILVNATSYALYLVLVKPMMAKYNPISVVTWIFTIGLFLVLPFGFSEAYKVNWSSMPVNVYLSLIYIILFTSLVAYLLNVWALKRVNASLVGYYIYLQPLCATLAAIFVFGESFHWHDMLYASLIFGGVYLVSMKSISNGN